MQTLSDSLSFLQQSLTSVNPSIDKYAILLKPSPSSSSASTSATPIINQPKPAKMIGIMGTKDTEDELEILYMLHCDYWTKGYMTEALIAVFGTEGLYWSLPSSSNFSFSINSICLTPFSLIIQARKSIKTLKAQIDVENIGSRKVIAKIGAREGETRLKSYELARDRGADGKVPEEKRRDMVWWYVDRPTK
jgi:RimJ/RimL family protein N-acetyltransferase